MLGTCRKLLGDPHDAQDAFQATFLVLVQKGRRLWVRDSLAPWLHRVASLICSRARASSRRRRQYERRPAEAHPLSTPKAHDWSDLGTVIQEEIDRLPERFRCPVVLCDVMGLSHGRAASQLGIPAGTVKSRLGRAREILRGRLSRRGLAVPSGLFFAAATAREARGGSLARGLVDSTVRAGVAVMIGEDRRSH